MNSSEEEDGAVERVRGREGRDVMNYGAVRARILHSGRDEKIGKKD